MPCLLPAPTAIAAAKQVAEETGSRTIHLTRSELRESEEPFRVRHELGILHTTKDNVLVEVLQAVALALSIPEVTLTQIEVRILTSKRTVVTELVTRQGTPGYARVVLKKYESQIVTAIQSILDL